MINYILCCICESLRHLPFVLSVAVRILWGSTTSPHMLTPTYFLYLDIPVLYISITVCF